MRTTQGLSALSTLLVMSSYAEMAAGQAVSLDEDDLAGVVRSENGPEAGVWVIAETSELPTRYVKIVVTNDEGRYLMPDLPKATYVVWVRGYGLVDSPKVRAMPGSALDLKATTAPNPRAAAEYYPAGYWFSCSACPTPRSFPEPAPRAMASRRR
jgi:hypothetical protein